MSELLKNGFMVYLREDKGWSDGVPFHAYYEINLSLSDGGRFFFREHTYDIEQGTLFLINDQQFHSNVSEPSRMYRRFVIHFMPEFVQQFNTQRSDLLRCFHNDNGNTMQLRESHYTVLLSMIKNLYNCKQQDQIFGSDIHANLLFFKILLFINRLNCNSLPAEEIVTPESKIVAPIVEYIRQNLNQKLSLDDIASCFFISKSQLCRIFKQATGISVNNYIIHNRMRLAKNLLASGLSVQEVSERVGYMSYTHFIRSFKKQTGLPPKRYINHANLNTK